jgi:predicted acylesterase/phospholipase RssA
MSIKNLVFSGGELRGLAYIGIQKALEELNIIETVENILGVSVGSIFALTICLGYTSSQIEKIVMSLEIEKLKDIEADGVFRIFTKYGVDSAKQFEKLYKILIKKKLDSEDATFSDLKNKIPGKNLLVWGTNLNLDRGEVFSYNTTPNMCLWEAIRISTCFPLYFEAYHYNNFLYADGGISNNYPIDYFHSNIEETLGIVLKHNDRDTMGEIDSFERYIISLVKCITQSTQNIMEKQYKKYTITLEIPYSFLNLDITNAAKKTNIDSGYNQFITKFRQLYKENKLSNPGIVENNETANEVISDIKSEISYRSNTIDIEDAIDNVL